MIRLTAATPILYHVTNPKAALQILNQNEFKLGSTHLDLFGDMPTNFQDFYLSTSRTRAHTIKAQLKIRFVLDGVKLSRKYKVKPFDYYANEREAGEFTFESEDRVFSNKPEIPNAANYISSIEINSDLNKSELTKIYLAAKKRKIPVIFFEPKDYKFALPTKAKQFKDIEGNNVTDIDTYRPIRKNRTFNAILSMEAYLKAKPTKDFLDWESNEDTVDLYLHPEYIGAHSVNKTLKTDLRNQTLEIFKLARKRGFTPDNLDKYFAALRNEVSKYSQNINKKINRLQASADDLHQKALDETGYWGKAGAGCLVYSEKTKRFLFLHRSEFVEEPNTWGIISGAIDPNENPKRAALRELNEETGFNRLGKIKRIEPIFVFKDKAFKFTNFLVVVEDEFIPKLDWENQGFKWVPNFKCPAPIHPKVKILLDKTKHILQALK